MTDNSSWSCRVSGIRGMGFLGCINKLRKKVFQHPDICSNFIIGYYVNQTFLVGDEKAMCDILKDEDM